MRYFLTFLLITVSQLSAVAQDSLLSEVQKQLDRQKELKKTLVYSFTTLSYVHKLDKQGMVEKTDTVKTWQKFLGDSLLERQIVYPSDRKPEKHQDGKGSNESMELPKLNDPKYEFTVNRSEGTIRFSPLKPGKGDLAGRIVYDPQDLSLKELDMTMPRLKWPVNEFQMKAKFVVIEGLLFPAELRMQAGWNALISRGRIRVESSNSDYKIYK